METKNKGGRPSLYNEPMSRFQIYAPDSLLWRYRRYASGRGEQVSKYIREALEAWIEEHDHEQV